MAHIEKRGPRRWRARYRGPDGKERSRTFDRKVDAERFLVSVESDKLRGAWVDPRHGALLLQEWSARWLGTLVHVKPKTLAGYESLLRTCVLPMFGSVPLARIEQPAVAAWVAEMRGRGLSASRTRQAYRVLSGMLDSAVQGGYLAKSPCSGIKLPRMARPPSVGLAARVDTSVTKPGEGQIGGQQRQFHRLIVRLVVRQAGGAGGVPKRSSNSSQSWTASMVACLLIVTVKRSKNPNWPRTAPQEGDGHLSKNPIGASHCTGAPAVPLGGLSSIRPVTNFTWWDPPATLRGSSGA